MPPNVPALLKWVKFFISSRKWFPKGVTNFLYCTEVLYALKLEAI